MKFTAQSIKKVLISFTFIFFVAACSKAPEPTEGEQYQLLPETLNSTQFAPVTEVFSLTCGHCRNMEDVLPELQKAVGQDIKKMHITFNQSAYVAAILYYAAEMQSGGTPDHQFMLDLFAAMQMPQGTTSEQQKTAMIAVFEKRGLVSPINYTEQQMAELTKKVDAIMLLSEQTKIQSVPTFIVKGKYQVISSGHEGTEDMAKTIKYLLAK